MGRIGQERGRRVSALATVAAVVIGMAGIAPVAAGAATAPTKLAPTTVPVGAQIPIRVDTAPPGSSLVMPEPTLRASSVTANAATATINVTYTGFSGPAQVAFQKAVDLWKPLISSSVPIKVNANVVHARLRSPRSGRTRDPRP